MTGKIHSCNELGGASPNLCCLPVLLTAGLVSGIVYRALVKCTVYRVQGVTRNVYTVYTVTRYV